MKISNAIASLSCLLVVAVVAPVAMAQNHRMVFRTFRSLVTARMDPVVSPGMISQHSHHVIGGSKFSATYNPDTLRQSKCSNLPVQSDKSNYWFPQIFRVLANNTYIGMQTGTRVYYELPDWLPEGVEIEPFPYNFQMVWGDPARKTYNASSMFDYSNNYYCDLGDSRSFASSTLPTQACKNLIMKLFMPCCWNGQPFNISDPSAHMAYPLEWFDGPTCPSTHPRRFPSMLIESFHFNADQPRARGKGGIQYILANGDTTGYGLHADFQNGWDQTVLQGFIDNCKHPNVTEPPEEACSYMAPFTNFSIGDTCEYEGTLPNESVGWLNGQADPLPRLPGCNLPWTTGPKPTCPPPIRGSKLALPVRWRQNKPGTVYP